jgi:hypothetical protein
LPRLAAVHGWHSARSFYQTFVGGNFVARDRFHRLAQGGRKETQET